MGQLCYRTELGLLLQEPDRGMLESVAAIRMLACPICSKVFQGAKRKYRLDRHMLVHWGVKPFICPKCPYRATQQGNLNRHIRKLHIDYRSGEENIGVNQVISGDDPASRSNNFQSQMSHTFSANSSNF